MCLDLFGGEIRPTRRLTSPPGLKGRYHERPPTSTREHRALEGTYELRLPGGGRRTDSAAPRDERGAARRLRAGLPARPRAMEPRACEHAALSSASRCRTPASIARSVRYAGQSLRPARKRASRRGIRGAPGRMAADRRGSRAHRRADAAGVRAGQNRGMDRAASQGHQRPAARVRVRDPELAAVAERAPPQNFAVWSLGQLRHKFNLVRHLVGRDHAAHVVADFLGQRVGRRMSQHAARRNLITRAPICGSGIPTTAASSTAGCSSSADSTSLGEIR